MSRPHGLHYCLWILQRHSLIQGFVDKLGPLHHVFFEFEALDRRACLHLLSAFQLCCAPDLLGQDMSSSLLSTSSLQRLMPDNHLGVVWLGIVVRDLMSGRKREEAAIPAGSYS